MRAISPKLLNYLDPLALYVIQPLIAGLSIVSLLADDAEAHILIRPAVSWICVLLLQLIFAEDIWSFSSRHGRRGLLSMVWIKLLGAGICGVLMFAAAYRSAGLMDEGVLTHDPAAAVYFSITAWSTVGYGDVVPSVSARPFAAAQALIGVLYDSAFIGLVLYASTRKAKSDDDDEQHNP